MSSTISFPPGINGVHEVGIAAGADDLPNPDLILNVVVKRTTASNPAPKPAASSGVTNPAIVDLASILGLSEAAVEAAEIHDFDACHGAVVQRMIDLMPKRSKNASVADIIKHIDDQKAGEPIDTLVAYMRSSPPDDRAAVLNLIQNRAIHAFHDAIQDAYANGAVMPQFFREIIGKKKKDVAKAITNRYVAAGLSAGAAAPTGHAPRLSSGVETMYFSTGAQALAEGIEVDVTATLVHNKKALMDKACRRLWNSAIVYVVTNGYFAANSRSVRVLNLLESDVVRAKPTYNADVEEIEKDGFMRWGDIATIIFATKVSFWLTNHHVGQTKKELKSFTGKVYFALEFEGDIEINRTTIWAAGKWCSTCAILIACRIKGIRQHPSDVPWFKIKTEVSADITMRVESYPGGTAKTTTYYRLYEHAGRSVYGVLVPGVANIDDIKAELVEIKKTPAEYHMGAMFLTGKPRKIAETFNEADMENLSGYIHAVAPSSKLAQAEVILKKEEVQGNSVYAAIQSVKARIAQVAGLRASMALVSQLSGGHLKGGIALQTGRISSEQVKDVLTKVEEEEKTAPAAGKGTVVAVAGPSS